MIDSKKQKNDPENVTANSRQQMKQNYAVLEKGEENNRDNKGWRAIKMMDPKTKRNESITTPSERSNLNLQNRKRRIRRERIKRKRKKGRKKPKRKRRHKKKGCRKKVKVNGKKICVKRRCTVAWCQNRSSGSLQRTSTHKYNFWGQDVTPI